eukprot:jgi/Chrzof1/2937/Cz12g05040.t1
MQQWSRKFPALCNFCGTLILQDDRAGLDPSADSSITSEYPTEHVASEELLQFEPAVAPGIQSDNAMFYPLEGWCNPIEAANYFLKGAEDHGATLLFNHQVEKLVTHGHMSDRGGHQPAASTQV